MLSKFSKIHSISLYMAFDRLRQNIKKTFIGIVHKDDGLIYCKYMVYFRKTKQNEIKIAAFCPKKRNKTKHISQKSDRNKTKRNFFQKISGTDWNHSRAHKPPLNNVAGPPHPPESPHSDTNFATHRPLERRFYRFH